MNHSNRDRSGRQQHDVELLRLSERKRRILATIIEAYIDTADPVGSKTIADRAGLGVSSATIRNEMAELEEMGWLEQPHTSAGRIPSARGYRAYVDYLMHRHRLTEQEMASTNSFLQSRLAELEQIVERAGHLLSEILSYPTLAMAPRLQGSTIRRIELLAVDRQQFVVVLVTSDGLVKNRVCRIFEPVPEEVLKGLSAHLDRMLAGTPLAMPRETVELLARTLEGYSFVLDPVLDCLAEAAWECERPSVLLDGAQYLLTMPEFQDLAKMRDFLSFLQDEQLRRQVLSPAEGQEGITVTIGEEHPLKQLQQSSVIMGNYRLGGKSVGVIAIIGPTRMKYSRVVSQLEYFTTGLNKLLAQLFDDEPP